MANLLGILLIYHNRGLCIYSSFFYLSHSIEDLLLTFANMAVLPVTKFFPVVGGVQWSKEDIGDALRTGSNQSEPKKQGGDRKPSRKDS